jgi:hypothetical protein
VLLFNDEEFPAPQLNDNHQSPVRDSYLLYSQLPSSGVSLKTKMLKHTKL